MTRSRGSGRRTRIGHPFSYKDGREPVRRGVSLTTRARGTLPFSRITFAPMPLSPATLAAARRLSAPAVAEVLREHYAPVHRLAHGLAGRADVGAGLVRYVMHRSIAIAPTWEEETQPENWFHRFTVSTARRSIHHRPDPRADLLLGDSGVTPD